MSDELEPRNDLERELRAAQEGRLTSDDFLNTLISSQVFMPVQDDKPAVLNVQRSAHARPLVLAAEDGTPILVLFSSPERSKAFLADYPGFSGGLLTDLKWVFEQMGSAFGIALNPGSELGFDMEPETVAEIAARVATDDKPGLQ